MAHYNSFEQLDIYQISRSICNEIWEIIVDSSLAKDYKLKDQINGSSGSVMDNIAEGFGLGGNKEFINFLGFSKGSCCEMKAQLQRCLDRKHIDQDQYDELEAKSQNLIDQISKFSNYLKSSEKRGSKFD
ncbi:MAG TPA: four helix bundle protein [Leeuwenhoekiella sp.]|nr:four helix bundle protein [Leeuwenhoekiella sp.]